MGGVTLPQRCHMSGKYSAWRGLGGLWYDGLSGVDVLWIIGGGVWAFAHRSGMKELKADSNHKVRLIVMGVRGGWRGGVILTCRGQEDIIPEGTEESVYNSQRMTRSSAKFSMFRKQVEFRDLEPD